MTPDPAPTHLVEGDILKRALTFYNRGEGLTRADILNMAVELTRLRKRVRVVAADPAPTCQTCQGSKVVGRATEHVTEWHPCPDCAPDPAPTDPAEAYAMDAEGYDAADPAPTDPTCRASFSGICLNIYMGFVPCPEGECDHAPAPTGDQP